MRPIPSSVQSMGDQQNCEGSALFFFFFTPHVCTIKLPAEKPASLHTLLITIASNNKLIIAEHRD